MRNASVALASFVLVLACSSCSTFSFVGTETHLRYDKDADVLSLLEIEHGAYSAKDQGLNKAVTAVKNAACGARIIPPDGGFFFMNFDRAADEPLPAGKDESSVRDRKQRAFAKDVKITKCGLFLDDAGQLSIYRLWSFPNFRAGIELLNEGIDDTFMEDDAKFTAEFPIFDEETRSLCRERARARGGWLSTQDGAFVLDVPMTPKCAARCLAYLLDESNKRNDPGIGAFWSRLSSLEIRDNHALLRFEPGEDGWIHFESTGDPSRYSPTILDAIKRDDAALVQSITLEQVRELMKKP